MNSINCICWVEDAPSKAVAQRLVAHRNASASVELRFMEGFPDIKGGYSPIKSKCAAFLNTAKAGICVFIITDLDNADCPAGLIRDWFAPARQKFPLPDSLVFRVAVREIEAWILADQDAFARYLGISSANFTVDPESLSDPKKYLLDVIRKKGTKAIHKEMLPRGTASIGPAYNQELTKFIKTKWSPARAAANAPSLRSAIAALARI